MAEPNNNSHNSMRARFLVIVFNLHSPIERHNGINEKTKGIIEWVVIAYFANEAKSSPQTQISSIRAINKIGFRVLGISL